MGGGGGVNTRLNLLKVRPQKVSKNLKGEVDRKVFEAVKVVFYQLFISLVKETLNTKKDEGEMILV